MEQMTLQIESMQDVVREIDNAQRKACTSIVEIGYILRKADDAELYKEKGFGSIFDFAKHEYGWDQSQTSRFMNINKEYSAGGYSCVLEERYEGYGQAKLAEMLNLPEHIREELSPDMKREEIRELKKEYKAAEEARTEEEFEQAFAPAQINPENFLQKSIRMVMNQEEYAKRLIYLWPYMISHDSGGQIDEREVLLALKPSGRGNARAGGYMYFFREEEIAILSGRDKEKYTYTDLIDALVNLSENVELSSPEDWYLKVFGKELPKEEVKSASNPHNILVDTDLDRPDKKTKKAEKKVPNNAEKEDDECHFSTGGTQPDTEKKESAPEAAVENAANPHNILVDKPLEGQTEIGDFTEEMPIKYEKSHEGEPTEEAKEDKTVPEAAAESAANNESPLAGTDSVIVPDIVDGVCQYCAGNKDIECNDGSFSIHLTSSGVGRIEKRTGAQGFGIIEFEFCPKCGKELG